MASRRDYKAIAKGLRERGADRWVCEAVAFELGVYNPSFSKILFMVECGYGADDSSDEQVYIVCRHCGEAFGSITAAYEHSVSDPNTKAWCGEDGFDLLPESEAL